MRMFNVNPIGKITVDQNEILIIVESKYKQALKELTGFSHVNVIWWFDDFDNVEARSIVEVEAPYKKAPQKMGIFATRSPIRPNPVALTVVQIINVDEDRGIIRIPYIDANHGSPVIDLKPYTPSLDRVESPDVPDWCRHWPKSIEQSSDFDWDSEFNF
ncbi:putative tRNA (adenine(37)-N6)-methyltransferase [compost metagenome]